MITKIKELLFTFVCVTTLVIFATAIYITVFWNDPILSVNILWQILGLSAICSLGNLIYTQRELTKTQVIIRVVLHYIYINIVVLGSGIMFEWFFIEQVPMVLGMLLTIGVVFCIVWNILRYRDERLAEQFNQRLEQYHKRD